MRVDVAYEEEEESDSEDVEDEVIEASEDEWKSDGLHVALMVLAIEIGDDPRDEDWIPDDLRRKHKARIARSKPSILIYKIAAGINVKL